LELALLIFAALLGATAFGIFLGHRARHLSESLKEPFGILQGALLGLVGLLLAFGLSLAVSRYEDRRANVVTEANAIGTAYLRAQTLPEPIRSRSLDLLVRYTQTAIRVADHVRAAPARSKPSHPRSGSSGSSGASLAKRLTLPRPRVRRASTSSR